MCSPERIGPNSPAGTALMLIKICGITTLDDGRLALSAGADWIGLNLVAGPRRVTLEQALRILAGLSDASRVVPLITTETGRSPEDHIDRFTQCGVRRFQLYGPSVAPLVHTLCQQRIESVFVHHAADEAAFGVLDAWLETCGDRQPTYLLLDAGGSGQTGQLGGTGTTLDWGMVRRAAAGRSADDWPPLLLAGGLTPDNVARAIGIVRPFAVDVSSGVETEPGRKDPEKLRAFIAAARDA